MAPTEAPPLALALPLLDPPPPPVLPEGVLMTMVVGVLRVTPR